MTTSEVLDRDPTAEERAETPLEPYVPLVPEPSMEATLPCPPGTVQCADGGELVCRIAGRPGESLSRRHGPALWFHPNGALKHSGHYDHHEWSGRWWSFDERGRLESSTAYVAGKEEGLAVKFHPNGTRRSECFYSAGELDGPSKTWTEDGELMSITTYERDRVVATRVFRRAIREPSAQELADARDELQRLLAEQQRLLNGE